MSSKKKTAKSSSSSSSSTTGSTSTPQTTTTDFTRRIQCFHCGLHFLFCQCEIKELGQDFQLVVEDSDLPSTSTSLEDKVKFWGLLLKQGQLTKRFNFDLFYQEQLVNRQAFELMRNESIKKQLYKIWDDYCMCDHFQLLKSTFAQISEENLKKAGREAWDSFFSGRWWELCRISIMIVMNSLESCGPNPFAPESQQLRVLADALQMVEVALKLGAPNEYLYSIVAPLALTNMKNLVAYQRIPAPSS